MKMNQPDFSKMCGISNSLLTKIETNQMPVTKETASLISQATGYQINITPDGVEIEYGGITWDKANHKPRAVNMTLRDWFAGQALTGILANSNYVRKSKEEDINIIDDAYEIAHYMMQLRADVEAE